MAKRGLEVRAGKASRRVAPVLLTLPAVWGLLIFFVAPALTFAAYSVLTAGLFEVSGPLTLDNFRQAVETPLNRTLARNSLLTGLMAAVAITLIALPMAYWLRYLAGRWRTPALFVIVVAMLSSYLVRIYSWRTILGENGIVNRALETVGLIDEPLDLLFNRFAVTVAATHLYLPLVILVLFTSLRPLEPSYLEAAQDLGANAFVRWRRVILPVLATPLASTAVFIFVLVASDWFMPSFLGGSSGNLLGQRIWLTFRELGDYPLGAALSLITLVSFVVCFMLVRLALRLMKVDKVRWST